MTVRSLSLTARRGAADWIEALRLPRVTGLAVSTLVARLPKAIAPLAIVYYVRDLTGSFAAAGTVAGAMALGDGLAAPVQGRLVDRFGRGRALVPSAVLFALAMTGLFAAGRAGAGTPVLVGCALLAGLGFPPVSGAVKTVWSLVASRPAVLARLYTFESLLQQLLFLTGPVLVTILTVTGPSGWGLPIAAAGGLAGTVAFVLVARGVPGRSGAAGRHGGALRVPAVRALVAATAVGGIAFGAMPVLWPAAGALFGHAGVGGLLAAAFTVGGIAGTFRVPLTRVTDPDPAHAYRRLLARLAFLLAPLGPICLLHTPAALVAVAVLLAVAGLFLTPIASSCYLTVQRTTDAGQRTEAFTWVSTAQATGTAAGSALAGLLVDRLGTRPSLFLPFVPLLAGAAVARLLRDTAPPPVPAHTG